MFWEIDVDNSGEIDLVELKQALFQLGIRMTLKKVQTTNSAPLFMTIALSQVCLLCSPIQLRKELREFDDDENGRIDLREFLMHFVDILNGKHQQKGLAWIMQMWTSFRHKVRQLVGVACQRGAETAEGCELTFACIHAGPAGNPPCATDCSVALCAHVQEAVQEAGGAAEPAVAGQARQAGREPTEQCRHP